MKRINQVLSKCLQSHDSWHQLETSNTSRLASAKVWQLKWKWRLKCSPTYSLLMAGLRHGFTLAVDTIRLTGTNTFIECWQTLLGVSSKVWLWTKQKQRGNLTLVRVRVETKLGKNSTCMESEQGEKRLQTVSRYYLTIYQIMINFVCSTKRFLALLIFITKWAVSQVDKHYEFRPEAIDQYLLLKSRPSNSEKRII